MATPFQKVAQAVFWSPNRRSHVAVLDLVDGAESFLALGYGPAIELSDQHGQFGVRAIDEASNRDGVSLEVGIRGCIDQIFDVLLAHGRDD